jgi:hypothetical protein
VRDRLARDPADLLDGLDDEAVLGWVREVIEVDLLGDQPRLSRLGPREAVA